MYDKLKLEKGMYATEKGFSGTLEMLDPSENYIGTELEGLDAYQRQLKRFDIRVNGRGSDMVEKFFKTTDSAALFPEFIARAVRTGMEEADRLSSIVASETEIDGMDYRTITSNPSDSAKSLSDVDEGESIPETSISLQSNLVHLKKRGRMLVASYEAIRFQRLDVFSVMLRQIGAHIARQQFDDAISVLINGDGNENPADTHLCATSGTLTYSDLINLWNEFSPYNMTTLVSCPELMPTLLTMSEFKDALAGQNFHGSGKMITPLGAELLKSASVPEGKILALDKNCALEKVRAGGILTEYDKLIDKQLDRAAISVISGFAKLFPDASKLLLLSPDEDEEDGEGDDDGDGET